MGPGEREYFRSEAVSTFRRMAAKGDTEASEIASTLEQGRLPQRISDRLFDELMHFSSPAFLTDYVMHAGTVYKLSEEGEDLLARRGEEKRGEMLTDAMALGNLAALGFLPSKEQRSLMVRMLADIVESERPIDGERPHVFHGTSRARSICFQALSLMAQALDERECTALLGAARDAGQKISLVERWLENAPDQARLASLMEKELSGILGDRLSGAQERVQAYQLRKRAEQIKAAAMPLKPPEPEKPRRPPGRKV